MTKIEIITGYFIMTNNPYQILYYSITIERKMIKINYKTINIFIVLKGISYVCVLMLYLLISFFIRSIGLTFKMVPSCLIRIIV